MYCTWAIHKETISVWRRHTTEKRSLFTSRKQKTPDSWQLNQHSECLPELHPYGPVVYLLLLATMTLLIWNSKVLILWKTCICMLNAKHSQQPCFSWGQIQGVVARITVSEATWIEGKPNWKCNMKETVSQLDPYLFLTNVYFSNFLWTLSQHVMNATYLDSVTAQLFYFKY